MTGRLLGIHRTGNGGRTYMHCSARWDTRKEWTKSHKKNYKRLYALITSSCPVKQNLNIPKEVRKECHLCCKDLAVNSRVFNELENLVSLLSLQLLCCTCTIHACSTGTFFQPLFYDFQLIQDEERKTQEFDAKPRI